jgi:nucleoid-associated protein YgaU
MLDDQFSLKNAIDDIKKKRSASREMTDIDRLDIGEKESDQSFPRARTIESAEADVKKVLSGRSETKKAEVARKLQEAKDRAEELDARDVLSTKARKGIVNEHIVAAGETLSAIALQYYGKSTPPYYQHIYNHNRNIIGDNINIIVPGQKLVIPELPEELK